MKTRTTRALGDSRAGFVALTFGRFHDALYRYLLHKLHHTQSAEDLTQEVFLRLLRTADHNMVRNPQAYVFGVAFNVLYEFRMHERRAAVIYDSDALTQVTNNLADAAPTPQELSEQRSQQRVLEGVMAQLSPMQQAVLLMAKRQELPHAEIARRLGISIGTVRKHLARAVSQFRKNFDE
jgi:RNA polymerase sigma factor (sigma-70 family)